MQPTSYPLISQDDPAGILAALVSLEVCHPKESITSVVMAGDGNMNLVLRVTTDRQSVIVKQARPWVEKYRDIPAPAERILAEICLLYTSPSPRDRQKYRMPSSA